MIDPHLHIPIEVIKKDIYDTEVEILQMEKEIKAFTILGDRWSMMKSDSRKSGIKERRDFIDKLNNILNQRQEQSK